MPRPLLLISGFMLIPFAGSGASCKDAPARVPPASAALIGNIASQLSNSAKISGEQFTAHCAEFIRRLPAGEIYFQVGDMDVDDDGSAAGAPAGWDPVPDDEKRGTRNTNHQSETSAGADVSAFTLPYVVLPGHKVPRWFQQQKIPLRSGAVIVKGDKAIVAIFADTGPDNKIGEMSVRAHQLLGFTAFRKGVVYKRNGSSPLKDPGTGRFVVNREVVRTVDHAQPGEFIVIVFPGISRRVSDFSQLEAEVKTRFQALSGHTVEFLN